MTLKEIQKASDNTIKLIFEEGFHCVLIPHSSNKTTLCISSQIGCAMGCKFCLTAKMGFIKNLTKEQIIEQFEESIKYLADKPICTIDDKQKNYSHEFITSIVFMGMGEPFNNYNNVVESIKFLNQKYWYPFKKITVSTSGIIPKIIDFSSLDFKSQLAISFHSPFQDVRNRLMPYLSPYKIPELVKACNDYSKSRKDKMMIEYIMIDGLTDREEDLKELLKLGFEKMTNFNLIPLNGSMDFEGEKYLASSMKRCEYFKQKLIENGFKCFIRFNMGEDIEAACGMLNY